MMALAVTLQSDRGRLAGWFGANSRQEQGTALDRGANQEGCFPRSGPTQHGDTTYLDAEGNAVSLVQSIFLPFSCGEEAGNTGLLLQNRMSAFTLNPEHVNRLEPHKRTALAKRHGWSIVDRTMLPGGTRTPLRSLGHMLRTVDGWSQGMGHAHLIQIKGERVLSGAADPRGDGFAVGY